MGSALHFDFASWNPARDFWKKLTPPSVVRDCGHSSSIWHRITRQSRGILIGGSAYCADQCLDKILTDTLQQLRCPAGGFVTAAAHRIPLGLVLLSRRQITAEELRTAIEAQRVAGRGRIGEWLQTLGFVTEYQITTALARQWSCPVLRVLPGAGGVSRGPLIPVHLLESFAMIPVEYVESTSTLHIAFAEGIDRSVLYALEQMLTCRTEPCLVAPTALRQRLRTSFEHRGPGEVVFDGMSDIGECVRIIRSYCTRVAPSEIRLVLCGAVFWVRLLCAPKNSLDLLFHAPVEAKCAFPALAGSASR
jgi:Type II secretion system (T2SS), protein E, N-terminal domain